MVKSILNPNINYPEIRALDKEDEDFEVYPWNIKILDIPVKIALGQSKDHFIDSNIIYFPIYLINKNDEVNEQIGIYEIKDTVIPSVLDKDDEELDIYNELVGEPLIYSFVTPELLKNKDDDEDEINEDIEDDDEEADEKEEDDDLEDDDDIEEKEDDDEKEEDDDEKQTEEIAVKEKDEEYTENEDDIWIKKFLQNDNYDVEDNEGGGDCLFAAIRDGLKTVNKDIPVGKMRKMLAEEVTENVFEGYKEQYDAICSEYDKNVKEVKRLSAEHKALKQDFGDSKDRNNQIEIINKADKIKELHAQAKIDKQNAKELKEEFEFMKGITTIEAFKAKVQTCDFWGETWTLSTLERLLNVKFILFSREAFLGNDFNNIIQCGQLNDTILEEKGIFEPDYYIMLDYLGDHYELITYKDKGAFTFKELPYEIKILISDNCLKNSSGGPYFIIPEFRKFINKSKNITEIEQDKEVKPKEPEEIKKEI